MSATHTSVSCVSRLAAPGSADSDGPNRSTTATERARENTQYVQLRHRRISRPLLRQMIVFDSCCNIAMHRHAFIDRDLTCGTAAYAAVSTHRCTSRRAASEDSPKAFGHQSRHVIMWCPANTLCLHACWPLAPSTACRYSWQ
jgi:hypothetical protein